MWSILLILIKFHDFISLDDVQQHTDEVQVESSIRDFKMGRGQLFSIPRYILIRDRWIPDPAGGDSNTSPIAMLTSPENALPPPDILKSRISKYSISGRTWPSVFPYWWSPRGPHGPLGPDSATI